MTVTLVVGGTGAMGSRVVRRLLATTDRRLRVLTRNPESVQARRLVELGGDRVELVPGSVEDNAAVRDAMQSVERVFCNTDFFSTGSVTGERDQGIALLEAARTAGVDRFVWSSLDFAAFITGGHNPVPHYDSKGAVAAHIGLRRSEEMMRKDPDPWYTEHVSVLTTAPYYENLQLRLAPRPGTLPDGRDGMLFTLPLGQGRYPMIGLDDIAWFAVHALEQWQSWGARDLAVLGDSLTGAQIAAAFERVTGNPAGYAPIPLGVLRSSMPDFGHDFAAMFEFFQTRDLATEDRDVPALRRIHAGLLDFEAWLRATAWDGTEQEIQKFPQRLPQS